MEREATTMKRRLINHGFAATATALCALFFSTEFTPTYRADSGGDTTTPIKHLVVIFQENVSFDHYFGTYPNAQNKPGEPVFRPSPRTPTVNGLTGALLTSNTNSFQPFRLDRSQQLTCDQIHDYTPEQQAFDMGLMDKFVEFTGRTRSTTPPCEFGLGKDVVMGYYDGNTVTALWNYAQHFAMSDNYYQTTFGPSTPGAVSLVSGQTHGVVVHRDVGDIGSLTVVNPDGSLTLIGNPRPFFDDCSPSNKSLVELTTKNVGDLLNLQGITWGWFQGGFKPDSRNPDGTAVCSSQHTTVAGFTSLDYVPHHEPFQYYASTANPHHLPPTSVAMIGHTDHQANHQYDLSDFWNAANAGNLPAVSFLKAAAYQDGHSENSDPLDEQIFVVNTINALEQVPQWPDTAVIITYDDSDGWYDHVMPPIVSQSNTPADALAGPGSCGVAPDGAYQGRCGHGPRLPLLVISRWAKPNFVDHQITDQTSILRFIEDNWLSGERIPDHSFDAITGPLDNMFNFGPGIHPTKLFLDPLTGQQ
jgi:phospholipase C